MSIEQGTEETLGDLSSKQLHALFDILTHHEAYAEIEAFKLSSSITTFGDPLQSDISPSHTSSPLIQILLHRFVLVLPGLRDVAPSFWSQNIPGLATALADANLSESYDKGSIGIRRTLSSAIAAVVEPVARGILGGFSAGEATPGRCYDTSKPEDVQAGWDDFLQGIIAGDLLARIVRQAAKSDDLSSHESVVKAAHEYILIMLASFMHYILIVSPRGQSMLPLLARANDMMPYFLIRQTLKVGNAASMLSGMVRIVLAKMNMSTLTSWVGGATSDSGMNLLQYIVSTVLGWDNSVLKKRAATIEQDKGLLSRPQVQSIESYLNKSAEEQRAIRDFSVQDERSIVACIFSQDHDVGDLTKEQHATALDYLAIRLSVRDRTELIRVVCQNQPDLITSSVRLLVTAYEPIIRALHQAVDLSSGVSDLQQFLQDLMYLARVDKKARQAKSPSVEDFCRLLKKHQGSSHRFIHQVFKNGPELSRWYSEYAALAASQYKRKEDKPKGMVAAGDFNAQLLRIYADLTEPEKREVIRELDKHSDYLASLAKHSTDSMAGIVANLGAEASNTAGDPGIYLAKWQCLMDETQITPDSVQGPVRTGKSESVQDATRVDTDGAKKGGLFAEQKSDADETPQSLRPDTIKTVHLLGPKFRDCLASVLEATRAR